MYLIRQASINDVDSICYIAEQAWWASQTPLSEKQNLQHILDEVYSRQSITSQISQLLQTYILIIENDKAVGFAAYATKKDNNDTCCLNKLYCLPNTQGKGYVKLLIKEVMEKSIKEGKHDLEIRVNRLNQNQGFYEKIGFQLHSYHHPLSEAEQTNDFVMHFKFNKENKNSL